MSCVIHGCRLNCELRAVRLFVEENWNLIQKFDENVNESE